jgi:hypothetical protein
MTTRKTPAQKERARLMAAARKSLALTAEAADAHRAALDEGKIPDGGFMPSAQKYHEILAVLAALDKLEVPDAAGAAPAGDDGLIEVRRADVADIVDSLRLLVRPEYQDAVAGSEQLARLTAASAAAGPAPAGAVQDGPGKA